MYEMEGKTERRTGRYRQSETCGQRQRQSLTERVREMGEEW